MQGLDDSHHSTQYDRSSRNEEAAGGLSEVTNEEGEEELNMESKGDWGIVE